MEKYKVKVSHEKLLPGDIGEEHELYNGHSDCEDDYEDRTESHVLFNEGDVFRKTSYPLDYVKDHPEVFAQLVTKSEEGEELYFGDEVWVFDANTDTVYGPITITGDYHKQFYFLKKENADYYAKDKKLYDQLKKSGVEKGSWMKHRPSKKVFQLKELHYAGCKLWIISDSPNEEAFLAQECELIEVDIPETLNDVERYDGFLLDRHGNLMTPETNSYLRDHILDKANLDVYPTKEKALSSAAFIQLSQLHHSVIEEFEKQIGCRWQDNKSKGWTVMRSGNELWIESTWLYHPFLFPTKEYAQKALELWLPLWKQYYELS